ncbi:MAG: alpha/beta fold hydrolase [Bacteroidota bacterium]
MRLFELLLLLTTAATPFIYGFIPQKKWQNAWLIGLYILVASHLVIEQPRWQLTPLYIAVILTPFYVQWTRRARIWMTMLILLLSVFAATLGTLLPVFKLPTPNGEYPIGSQLLFLEDESRSEDITPEESDKRRLTVKIWYPSAISKGKRERYLDNGLAQAFGKDKHLPGFIFSHFPLIKTHTIPNVSMADGSFPVILLSHGYQWNAELYTSIVESLVSEGFIIVGLQHTHEAPLTIWKEERLTTYQSYFDGVNAKFDFPKYQELEAEFKASQDEEEQLQLMRDMMAVIPYGESVDRWAADISFVIDQLEAFQKDNQHFLHQKLNLDQIGMLGHSFGGAAAAQACAFDNRIRAGVNMDGSQSGRLIDTTITAPFLALYADRNYEEFFTPNFFIYDQVMKGKFYEGMIRQTGHANFGDLGYWTPMHALTETGTISSDKIQSILTNLLLQFLRDHVTDEIDNWEEQEYDVLVDLRRVQ